MISIPCPAPLRIPPGYVIARMRSWSCSYVFHWLAQTSQVLIERITDNFGLAQNSVQDNESQWILQTDGNILNSISALLNCNPNQIRIRNWNLMTDDRLPTDYEHFLTCNWSDYAVDNMSVEFDIYLMNTAPMSRFASPSGGSPVYTAMT